MSRTIIIHRCKKCGNEFNRQVNGNPENPDGSYSETVQFKTVGEQYCPYCMKKGEEHG